MSGIGMKKIQKSNRSLPHYSLTFPHLLSIQLNDAQKKRKRNDGAPSGATSGKKNSHIQMTAERRFLDQVLPRLLSSAETLTTGSRRLDKSVSRSLE
jgi:hypothetical protein